MASGDRRDSCIVTGSGRIHELVTLRAAGELTRDDYWAAIQQVHLGLLDYRELLVRAGIAAIEVAAAGLRIRFEDGTAIGWDPADLRSPPAVLLNEGEYEATEWTVVRALGSRSRTVLDVGANIGWYSVRLAAERGDRPGIHAFEPIATTFERLAENIRLNAFDGRIAAHDFGLSDRNDTVQFYVPQRTGTVAASERALFGGEAQTVATSRIRRLDDCTADAGITDIDFVKCDIEGGEFGFLRGAEQTLAVHRPTILLELLRKWAGAYGYHPNDVIAWMAAREYRCAAIREGAIRPITVVTDETVETNYLFVHASRVADVVAVLRPELRDVELV
jgi:FkbM family methyltransferase